MHLPNMMNFLVPFKEQEIISVIPVSIGTINIRYDLFVVLSVKFIACTMYHWSSECNE